MASIGKTASITVSNKLPQPPGESLRAALSQMDVNDRTVLEFPYAPHEISIKPSPSWTARKAAGAVVARMDWTGNAPKVIKVSTRQSASPGKTRELENFLTKLISWAEFPVDTTQMPSRLLMSWGQFSYSGVLTGLEVHKEVLDDEGRALVARVSFSLTESL